MGRGVAPQYRSDYRPARADRVPSDDQHVVGPGGGHGTRNRSFRACEYRKVVFAESRSRRRSSAGGRDPDHCGSDPHWIRPQPSDSGLAGRPRSFRTQPQGTRLFCGRAFESREPEAGRKNSRALPFGAVAGRHHFGGHARGWLFGYERSERNPGIPPSLRCCHCAGRCWFDAHA